MFKHRSVAVAGALVVGLALAACGGGGSAGGGSSASGGASSSGGKADFAGKTLSVYIGAMASYPTQQQQWEQRINDAFKKATGATINFETYTSGDQEQQKIQTSVVSGQGPDVYEIGTTFTPTAYATGAFRTLSTADWDAIGGKDKFVQATLAMSGPSAKKQIAVPLSSLPFLLAYNKDAFAAAGIAGPPQTWDELVADGKKLTAGGKYGLAGDYKDNFNPWKYVWMFSNQYGNPLVKGKKVTLDDAAVAKAYDAYFGFLTRDKIVNPAAANWTATDALTSFANGESAMVAMVSPSALPTLTKSPVANSFAFAPMPSVPPGETSLPSGGVPATTIISGQNMVVATYSKQQDLAMQYIKLVTSDAEQQHYSEIYGVLPTNAKAAQAVAASNPNYEPVLAAGKGAKPTPFTGAWSQIQLGLMNIVVQSRNGLSQGSVASSSVKSQLATLQKTAQTAVDQAAAAGK
jgi:multiple sugar transport system substrate-binding protein